MFRTVVDGGKLVSNVVEHSVSERNRGDVAAATGVQRRFVSNPYSSQKASSAMGVSSQSTYASYSLGCRR